MVEHKPRICSICQTKFVGYGHNPEPILDYEKRCCSTCNWDVVIPIRLFGLAHQQALTALQKYGLTVRRVKVKGGDK